MKLYYVTLTLTVGVPDDWTADGNGLPVFTKPDGTTISLWPTAEVDGKDDTPMLDAGFEHVEHETRICERTHWIEEG